MDNNEVFALSPLGEKINTSQSVCDAVTLAFHQSYWTHNPSSLTAKDYLKYKLSEMETTLLPFYLKSINMHIVTDPHYILSPLQAINDCIMCSSYTISLFGKEISPLITDCKNLVKNGVGS